MQISFVCLFYFKNNAKKTIFSSFELPFIYKIVFTLQWIFGGKNYSSKKIKS